MADIGALQNQKAGFENGINAVSQRIAGYEKAYESLRRFKGVVENSHGDFDAANSGKLRRIEDLNTVKKNCKSAELYLSGSKKTLNGIGGKIVGAAFGGLGFSIQLKLSEYRAKIAACEVEINMLTAAVRSVDEAIRQSEAENG